eukprot:gnl/MRDRNA2_/MRDRNA2_83553_c0_seq1.p1 gnl/MRDRNA2_/MRDRNA2_83553_c0~~gnl/MRDRNA2_/MRDRNA2_83553_c0_seq1.p1  ORF type:complete len:245 (-),score=48.02 gnl/MRDRNA2_/MRDRNA2_83553_c0_seq1:147-881(-)
MEPPRRLLLTSCGANSSSALKDELRNMIGPEPESKTCWYLPTAALREGMGSGFVQYQVASLKSDFRLGRIVVVDPEYVKGEKLSQKIRELGRLHLIYAEMGNTYALRHHLRTAGGDELIRKAMDDGAIYVGASAGSICAGRTIQTAFWKDWDDKTAQGTINVDWAHPEMGSGLDLCEGRSFFPHANGPLYGRKGWQDQQAQKHGHTDHEVIKLADGEGFVIDTTRTDGRQAYHVEGNKWGCLVQ